ncbi:hypothetical protein BaRGS_00017241 [Batillaria attramentaria]|uniref:Endonuclease/exonuclease/phosphatase domain-containing protein n=1 Tax=Batillaria attramentaria TaxID=370345 RepID=A0ABD0KWX5_9CAEN
MPERDAVRATDMEVTICRLLVVIVVLVTTTVSQANNERRYLRIGAFNAKTFGRTKMSNPQNRDYFRQIVERYDVLLIQEVRDSSQRSVRRLRDILTLPFDFVISQPLGRSSYKEQYAFFYRKDRVIIFDQSQYADNQDVFEREPFSILMAAMWSCTDNDEMSHGTSDRLVLTGFHSTPRDATAEIGHLRDVLDNLRRQFGVQTVVMGDLNASLCSCTQTVVMGDLNASQCSCTQTVVMGDLNASLCSCTQTIVMGDLNASLCSCTQTVVMGDLNASLCSCTQTVVTGDLNASLCSCTQTVVMGDLNASLCSCTQTVVTGDLNASLCSCTQTIVMGDLNASLCSCTQTVVTGDLNASLCSCTQTVVMGDLNASLCSCTQTVVTGDLNASLCSCTQTVVTGDLNASLCSCTQTVVTGDLNASLCSCTQTVVTGDLNASLCSCTQTVVMGDLNADCRYSDNDDRVRAGDYLTTSTNYTWLIGDDIDTTTSNTTHCAYDRIIIPSALTTQVVSGSATAFHFGDYLQLSAAQALMISDHFPVEMILAM